jgi:hypothetical protein
MTHYYIGTAHDSIYVYKSVQDRKYTMDISKNNMVTLAHVKVSNRDYYIHISYCITSQNVHIFKYSDTACDYGVFESQEYAIGFINISPGSKPKFL